MILRVPDYYEEFSCIADRCKDSCCIGWEIDIDEDTCAYYHGIPGAFGDRLRGHMYVTEDKEHSFRLGEHGRCPFLNDKNLCDIITALGEEALSEVCTEYPRFSLYYGDVLQKCLSLSCEEVGRILFTREAPVAFVDYALEEPDWDSDDEDANQPDEEDGIWEDEESQAYEAELVEKLYAAQLEIIALLQDRGQSIQNRIVKVLQYSEKLQKELNKSDKNDRIEVTDCMDWSSVWDISAERFEERLSIFLEMETLDAEWEEQKAKLQGLVGNEAYVKVVKDFLESQGFLERDYENLLVYFVFRYFMNAVYDQNVLSKVRMAVEFTLLIRDMDAIRLADRGTYTVADRIDVVRIFSKEVEHSEENVAMAEEEILWLKS